MIKTNDISYVKLKSNNKIPVSTHINWQNEKCPYEKVKNHKGNLGMATGNISNGLYVLDWDFRKDMKEEGFKVIYKEYEKTFPKLSKTKIVSTPHGYHFYYILKGVKYGNTSQKNGGYSSKLKFFYGSNPIRFGKFLGGFDSRGNGGYVVSPPSVINGLKYKIYNDVDPIEITDKQYESIFIFFKETNKQANTMRSAFVDIANGKLNPQTYKQETKMKEHVYWKEFYHEVYSCLSLLPEDLFDGLEKNNAGFVREKTILQLNNAKNINYILDGKRLSTEKYKEYFPKYKQIKQIDITKTTNIVQETKTLKQILSTLTETSTTQEIKSMFLLIPEDDTLMIEDVCQQIKKVRNIGINDVRALYKLTHSEEQIRLEKQKKVDNDIFSDEIKKQKEGLICNYDYKNGIIENRVDGVYFCTTNQDGYVIEEQALESPIKLIHKTKFMNTDLFSYKFRENTYNTQSREDILSELDVFRYGGDKGRDVIKKLITCLGNELEYTKLELIMGFNNKWILPQLQEENNYRILITTDFQKRVYKNSKELFSDDFDIENIKKKLKAFLKETTMLKGKVAMILGWSIAQLFRLAFIKYFKFAPDLLLVGDPQTGKTAFSEIVITDFYKAWDIYLQGAQIATKSSFEDACSTSTFPILADELEHLNYDVIGPMKSRVSGIPDFSRKTSAKTMFRSPEVAGFCITTNDVPKPLLNTGIIERFLVINFATLEVINEKQKWNNLARQIKKLNIFSPIYHNTKEWTNIDVFELIEKIQNQCPLLSTKSRERKKYIFVVFGLTVFDVIFGTNLAKNINIELFKQSQTIITGDLLNDFQNFCNIAINYDYGGTNANGTFIKGNNPKYLQTPLQMNNRNYYIFIPANLHDFKEFTNEKYSMPKLIQLLNKAIGIKDYFKGGTPSLDNRNYRGFSFPEDFNDKIKELYDKNKKIK